MISWPTLKVNWGFNWCLICDCDHLERERKKWTVENELNDSREKKIQENTWKVLWIISD